MEYALSLIALILCWIFIELFMILNLIFNKRIIKSNYLSINKFKWIIRFTILILFLLIVIYMYFFQTEDLKKTISLCISLII